MKRVLLGCGIFTVVVCSAAAAAAQVAGVPGVAVATSPSRQAEDRRVDESSRQTQAARQTEAPRPAEKPSAAPAKADPAPAFQRQAEPRRQPEPQRQHEPHRQAEPSRQNNPGHWDDPGPAWRPQGPAWRDQNDRPNVPRPGDDAFRATGNTYAPRARDGRRDRKNNSPTYYGYPPYIAPFGYAPYVEFVTEPAPEPAATAVEEPRLGFLQLRVQPRTAEVWVDGVLAGTVDDFGGRSARQLPAGPHRVEIMAPGYETLTFDVRVPENDTVTFTHELERAVARPAPVSVVIPHKALYVVPQCYLGDRMPLPTDMPAGCRVEDVRVIP